MKMKVFIGTKIVDGKQARVLVAHYFKKRVSEITSLSMGHINNFFSVTSNRADIERALQNQESIIVKEWIK